MNWSRRRAWFCVAVLAGLCAAFRQEAPNAAELKKMYDDAIAQLRTAQDRKNALATENEKLQKQLAELQRRCAPLEARNAELERSAADYAERTYEMRSTHAAWREFIARNPDAAARWNAYLRVGSNESVSADLLMPDWPLR